jgi:hypothetical protein
MYPSYWVNKKIRDKLSESGPVPRVAGTIKDGILVVELIGAEKFLFDPKTEEITTFPPYKHNFDVDEFKVDTALCQKLYYRTLNYKSVKKTDPFEQDRKDLHITKKSISEKDQETIRKYRNAFVSDKTSGEASPSEKNDGNKSV